MKIIPLHCQRQRACAVTAALPVSRLATPRVELSLAAETDAGLQLLMGH